MLSLRKQKSIENLFFVTRFSFFGASGFKSEFSNNPELLFAEERLEKRFEFFEKINLASLKAQTDENFSLLVMSSALMPEIYKERLVKLCTEQLGEERVKVRFFNPMSAKKAFRIFVSTVYGGNQYNTHIVLDDDDGLGVDYVKCLKEIIANSTAIDELDENVPHFISLKYGLALLHSEAGNTLYHHRYPFINLGLAMLSKGSGKNTFSVNHTGIPHRFSYEFFDDDFSFVRSVHDFNDSRVKITNRWSRVGKESHSEFYNKFPYLTEYLET